MAYYNQCARCGANLDPGERCGCQTKEPPRIKNHIGRVKIESKAAAQQKGAMQHV